MFLRSISGPKRYSPIWKAAAEKLPIGPCLQESHESCPVRNKVLGDHFFTFAVRLSLHTNPKITETDRANTRNLHMEWMQAIQRLTLSHWESTATLNCDDKIKLPSTDDYLPNDITKALNQWKHNAFHETKSLLERVSIQKRMRSENEIEDAIMSFNLSLIGWYLQKYGMLNTFELIEWLGIPIRTNTNELSTEFFAPVKSPLDHSTDANAHKRSEKLKRLLDGYEMIEKKLNYTFRDKSFMLQAFSHESFTANDICPNYESLDFVGDSIINYVICRHLFRDSRRFSAHELEHLTSVLVSNSCFATVSVRHQFHKYLRHTNVSVRNDIEGFSKFIQKNQCKPVNDLYFLTRKDFVHEVPPIIPDSFEALIAAIYFDSSMNLNAVANTMINLMQRDIDVTCREKPKPAMDELFELDRNAIFSKPETIGPGQIRVQVTLPQFGGKSFSGISRSAKMATWAAAKSALVKLNRQFNEYIPDKAKDVVK